MHLHTSNYFYSPYKMDSTDKRRTKVTLRFDYLRNKFYTSYLYGLNRSADTMEVALKKL